MSKLIGLCLCWWPLALAAVTLPQRVEIHGQAIEVPVQAEWLADAPLRLQLQIDLQPLLLALREDTLRRLPHAGCSGRSREHWMAYLNAWSAQVEDDRLALDVGLDVELRACLRWRDLKLDRRLAEGRVRLGLDLLAEAEDGALRVRALRPRLRTAGPLGDAAELLAELRGERLAARAAALLEEWNQRQTALPLPATLVAGRLHAARFVDNGRPTLQLQIDLQPRTPSWWRWLGNF